MKYQARAIEVATPEHSACVGRTIPIWGFSRPTKFVRPDNLQNDVPSSQLLPTTTHNESLITLVQPLGLYFTARICNCPHV
jgi:hypothetical protein